MFFFEHEVPCYADSHGAWVGRSSVHASLGAAPPPRKARLREAHFTCRGARTARVIWEGPGAAPHDPAMRMNSLLIWEGPGACSPMTGEQGLFNVTKRDGADD